MKINIGRDSLHAHNLSEHSQGYRYRLASQWLEFSFEHVEINTIDHFISTGQQFVYEIGTNNGPKYWCVSTDGKCNLFQLLSDKLINALKKRQCVLHIDQTMEAFPLHEYETPYNDPRPVDFYKHIHYFLDSNQIDGTQVIYSTSNLLEPDEYEKWLNKHNIQKKINIVALPFFACATQQRGFFDLVDRPDTGDNPHDVLYEDQLAFKSTNDCAVFNCLNRVDRVHRNAFVAMLNHYDLIENNIVSHNIFMPHIKDYIMMERWPDHPAFQKSNVHDTKNKLPLTYDMKNFDVNYAQNFNKDIYKKTWFSVITETFYQEPCPVVFFSEKIFKPMRAHHPFIVVGHPHSIKWLNKIGFITFDKWWDESYDDIQDPTQRMDEICRLLTKLSTFDQSQWIKIYQQQQHVLKHNYKKLIETNWYADMYRSTIGNIFK